MTPALREAYASGDDDELADVAMTEAARASLRLIAAEQDDEPVAAADDTDDNIVEAASIGSMFRRAVIAADVEEVTLRPDLDDAVVRLPAPLRLDQVASVHVDLSSAEHAVRAATDVIDAADWATRTRSSFSGTPKTTNLLGTQRRNCRSCCELL